MTVPDILILKNTTYLDCVVDVCWRTAGGSENAVTTSNAAEFPILRFCLISHLQCQLFEQRYTTISVRCNIFCTTILGKSYTNCKACAMNELAAMKLTKRNMNEISE